MAFGGVQGVYLRCLLHEGGSRGQWISNKGIPLDTIIGITSTLATCMQLLYLYCWYK